VVVTTGGSRAAATKNFTQSKPKLAKVHRPDAEKFVVVPKP